jgi:hypothetical protein
MNTASQRKREELQNYIQCEVIQETAVQAIVVIGSVAKGTAREDSDIDAFVFLSPHDLYAVPAESQWQPETGNFYGIFNDVPGAVQLDFHRLDLAQMRDPDYAWSESVCAELQHGWIAFDRTGEIAAMIVERTRYGDEVRLQHLDEAIVRMDWLLSEWQIAQTWENLGPVVAHYRLHTAWESLAQGLFAYNRCWRTLRSRELTDLLSLPWLPARFEEQPFLLTNALAETEQAYQQRATALRACFMVLVQQCRQEGLYDENAVSEAFIRRHDEPGRAWNMDEWNERHRQERGGDV